LLDSDPDTNSFVRVWGDPSRTADGKRRGRAYLEDALVAGKGLGEDVRRDQWRRRSARVVGAREEGRTEEGGKK